MKTLAPPPAAPPVREDYGSVDQRHFRRNLIGVAVVHALLLLVLFLAGMLKRPPRHDEVLWLSEGALGGGERPAVSEPEPEPELSVPDLPQQQIEEPIPVPPEQNTAESEIVEPKATPKPATPKLATPKPATPKPATPKRATPKATPKTTPKSKTTPKPKPETPQKAKSDTAKKPGTPDAAKKDADKTDATAKGTGTKPATTSGGTGDGTGKGKTGTGKDGISQFGWYTDMLHDRYYSRWEQPVGIGQDVVATVRLRIMKDGTISKHDMVKSSGNPQMDESVMSAVQKVEHIDPLPAGLGNGEYFDLNVAFKVGG